MYQTPTYEDLSKRVADLEDQLAVIQQAEPALERSRALLNSIITAAPVGIGLVADRTLLWVNDQMSDMVGYAQQDLIGKSSRILYASDTEFEQVLKKIEQAAAKEGAGSVETTFLHRNEQPVHVLLSFVPVNSRDLSQGITFTAMDITYRIMSEEKLIEERDRAQMYLETAGVMLVALDTAGKIRLINKKGMEISGFTEAEVLGRSWFEVFLPESDSNLARTIFFASLDGEVDDLDDYENTIVTRNGDCRNMIWHNRLLRDNSGRVNGVFCSGLDITEQTRMEKEKQALQLQLIKTQKMEAIGVLAGGIAHDFNNILLPILGYTELLLESDDGPNTSHDILNQILQAAKRARSLVSQILTFSRQENHEIKPVDIAIILGEVVKLVRSSLPSTIAVQQQIKKDCGLVMADPSQIHQVAMNLITNAFHAMEIKGGQLSIRLFETKLPGRDSGDLRLSPGRYVCLSVGDTGEGMSKAVLDRIFDPYFTTKKKGKGTGLGLSVVHGIVKSCGGYVKATSVPGEGTDFEVFLPALSMAEKEKEAAVQKKQFHRGTERILLVDDEAQVIQMETQRLEHLGYQVSAFTDPVAAFALFERDPEQFDLVITDMTMPKMTGGELSKRILKLRPGLPVIICSGFSEQVDAEKAREMGIQGFIQKPILLGEISTLIRKVLDRQSDV